MFEVSENSVIGFYAQEKQRSKGLNITFWVLQSLAAADTSLKRLHAGERDAILFASEVRADAVLLDRCHISGLHHMRRGQDFSVSGNQHSRSQAVFDGHHFFGGGW